MKVWAKSAGLAQAGIRHPGYGRQPPHRLPVFVLLFFSHCSAVVYRVVSVNRQKDFDRG